MHQVYPFSLDQSHNTLVCVAAVLVLIDASIVLSDDSSKSSPECEHADFLLSGIEDARARLHSGIYSASGHMIRRDQAGAVDGEVSAFGAFDTHRRFVRFDRFEPQRFFEANGAKSYRLIGAVKIVHTPERTLLWDRSQGLGTSHFLSIHPPDFKGPPLATVFDVRTFGMMGWSSIDAGTTLDQAMNFLRSYKVVDTKPAPDGTCLVTFRHGPNNDVKTSLWIDHTHGYTITRYELRALNLVTTEWSDVVELAEVKWKQVGEVWVPTSLSLERNFNGPEVYHLDFEWRLVNEPPPGRLFEAQGLDVDPESVLVDRRLGDKAVVIGKIGGSNDNMGEPVQQFAKDRMLVILVINLILLGLIAAYFWVRRQRSIE